MKRTIYFDNAATSWPKPVSVYRKMDEFIRKWGANPGRAGHRMAVGAERIIEETRYQIAQFFSIKDYRRIIFTLNCTDSLNIGIKGLLRKGDHVITTYLEHNSVSRPLEGLFKKGIITITRIHHSEDGFVDLEELRNAFTPKTRLVVVVHGSNVIGSLQPIREIGKISKEKGVIFMVDAAQTAGVIPIDVETDNIDLLAFPGHKALFGPPGTGGLYVGPRVDLEPWREGGSGVDSESELQPEELPFKLEGGTINTVGVAGLGAGITFIQKEGIEKIRQQEMELTKYLLEKLSGMREAIIYGPQNGKMRIGTVSFNIKDLNPAELGAVLDGSFGIACRTGLHCAPHTHKKLGTFPEGTVRFSLGYFNTKEEVDFAIDSLTQISA
ncbi:aminotransferase class V-fold PLP-dependent enzyme [bacterium]|nr:aminotransferase class V-fold PLP-dependent enzyme [bacterium]NIN92541.1 aminotransferase class V-fold PLP-dependent enzyme [bacterium]NIO18583.1 aminotransferase class V-fold PLP-dependent enzyme [bacterium]NIO73598.1 aminotransferase class V-fold PLP-dependent enzyme [bacterium]